MQHDQLAPLLADSALALSPSEAHGLLCGLTCGGAADPEQAWLEQVLPPPAVAHPGETDPAPAGHPADAIRAGLAALARETLEELQGPERRLTVLLPAEDRSLAERATALYDWVRGFLFALGVLGVAERDLSVEAREVLRDFTNITHMDLTNLPDDEENEAALAELTEFCWVAAMLIFEERAAPGGGS